MSPSSALASVLSSALRLMPLNFRDAGYLADKIAFYNSHDDTRRVVAAAGMRKYRRLFDARRVLRYMAETAAGEAHSEPYEWGSEVYR